MILNVMLCSFGPDQPTSMCVTGRIMTERPRRSRSRRPGDPPAQSEDFSPHIENQEDRWTQFMQQQHQFQLQMQQQQQEFTRQMLQHVQSQAQPQPTPQAVVRGNFREFYRMSPPEFQGGLDPVLALDWLSEIERVFKVITCTEEDKVLFASHMMKGPAARWWTSAETRMMTLGIPKDWEHFKAAFLDHYFPNSLRAQKELEFQQLRQGSMSITTYAEKFEDMAAYSRQAAYAPDKNGK